ncbi:MAG: YeeE/YedE family protein [Colwellia sp.]|nr:YeeE/YedE family protein [Colwellia sp.]
MKLVIALISGVLFGVGLTIAQMVNPAKVLNFLDIAGHWDPSLALVMASALTIFGSGYFLLVQTKDKPLLDKEFIVSKNKKIDNSLVVGATVFGLGWGLIGICPGPALAILLTGNMKFVGFFIAMLIGMQVAQKISKTNRSKSNMRIQ